MDVDAQSRELLPFALVAENGGFHYGCYTVLRSILLQPHQLAITVRESTAALMKCVSLLTTPYFYAHFVAF